MSKKNTLEAKKLRREERERSAIRLEKKRALQARINYLAYAPPETFDDLEAEIDKAIEEANEE
jgi:hypothetical protein